MKIILSSLFVFLLFFPSENTLEGIYKQNDQEIQFTGSEVQFNLKSNGGLIINLRGQGTYKMQQNFLLIKTDKFDGLQSTVKEKIPNTDEFIDFSIKDKSGLPISPQVTLTFMDTDGEIIGGDITDQEGLVSVPRNQNINKINLSTLAYDDIEIAIDSGFDYYIEMLEGKVIEEQNLLIMFTEYGENQIGIRLLNTDFTGKEHIKSFRRAQQKADRLNIKERIMIKVNAPIRHR